MKHEELKGPWGGFRWTRFCYWGRAEAPSSSPRAATACMQDFHGSLQCF